MRASVARLQRGIVFGRERAVRVAALGVVFANGDLIAIALARGPIDPTWAPIALGIGILALAAFLRPIEPAPGEKFSVAAAAAFFSAAVMPPAFAVASIWGAALAAKIVQRRSVVNTAVNVSQATGATATAALVLDVAPAGTAVVLALAATAYFLVTLASVGLMVVASQGLGPARSFVTREAIPTAALLGVGAVAALAWTRDPLAVLLFVPVLLSIELAVRRPARDRSATAAAERERRDELEAAHELRTPLATLASDLAFIRGPLPPEEASALASARDQALRLTDLVDRLLMLARVEGRVAHAGGADVCTVARRVASGIELHQDVDLHLDIERGLAVAIPDDLLEVVIRDLVGNALAYTRAGSVRLAATAQNGHAVITVADTGIGMTDDEVRHAFDRFYRGARAAAMSPGTGLGLAIVKRVVEGYGGSLTISSTPGRGTAVAVTLPRADR